MTLHGRRIALTRPAGLNDEWQQQLGRLGAVAVVYPLLRLCALATPPPAAATDADGWIFISPGAVALAWPVLQGLARPLPLPAQQLAAIGSGTAAALQQHGACAPVLHPRGSGDSASLLQCLPDVKGRHWVLVRGEGGRNELYDELQLRGAIVHDWRVYRREADVATMQRLLDELDSIDALVLTSSETLRTLFAQAGESMRQRLQSTALVVLHPRIAAAALALGARRVAVCDGAAELPAALGRVIDD